MTEKRKKPSLDPSSWNDRRAAERLEQRTIQMGENFATALDDMIEAMKKNNLPFQSGVALLGLLSNKAMRREGFTLEQTLIYNEQAIETFYKLDGSAALAPPETPSAPPQKVPQKVIDTIKGLEEKDANATAATSLKRFTELDCAILASWFINEFSAGTADQLITIVAPFVTTAKKREPSFNVLKFKENLCTCLIQGRFGDGKSKHMEALIIATLPL